MNAQKIWKLVPILLVCCAAGAAYAKLPPPPPVDPVKAEEAKNKAAEAAKQEAEELAKAQDRVAERYKKEKGNAAAPAPAAVPAKKR